jgi:hypothetical protein
MEAIDKLIERRNLKLCLNQLEDDPNFKFFLAWLCRECGVTKPRFSKDPQEIVWNESKRHLATSVLTMLGKDITDYITEESNK